MSEAYDILGLTSDCNEAELRARYLQLVRESPPDRDPERFARIRAAYDELRDPVAVIERKLFIPSKTDTIGTFEKELVERLTSAKISSAALLSLADDV
jgi:curved DNA-binding protein CbpA